LGFILGLTDEVIQFDRARKRLRASPNNIKLIDTYADILPVMESKISQEQNKIKQRLKKIEHEYLERKLENY
jgi:hypothetical protein